VEALVGLASARLIDETAGAVSSIVKEVPEVGFSWFDALSSARERTA
jgi:hypothetical protein